MSFNTVPGVNVPCYVWDGAAIPSCEHVLLEGKYFWTMYVGLCIYRAHAYYYEYAARSQERDCSCISDHNGDKVCVPEGCDSPQRKLAQVLFIFISYYFTQTPSLSWLNLPQYQELTASDMVADETQCVCLVKGDSGRKVCQPANCDRGRTPPEVW